MSALGALVYFLVLEESIIGEECVFAAQLRKESPVVI